MVRLDPSDAYDAYILGILWGAGSFCGNAFFVRHKDPWFPQTVKDRLEVGGPVYTAKARTGQQARLKVAAALDVLALRETLLGRGWTERNSERRPYPSGNINDRGFVRAWIEMHSSIDIARTGRRRLEVPRLRIYGNLELLSEINGIISGATRVPLRRLQRTSNEHTKVLYYYGSSCAKVLDWLYSDCRISNDRVRERFSEIVGPPARGRGKTPWGSTAPPAATVR